MSTNLKIQIKDIQNNALYPQTHASLVKGLESAIETYLSSSTSIISAVQNAASPLLEANSAMQFKGTLTLANGEDILKSSAAKQGWTYLVNEAGTYAGQECEIGDMIICNSPAVPAGEGTEASDPSWSVIQTNINGAVTASSALSANTLVIGNGEHGIESISMSSAASLLKNPLWDLVSNNDILGKITLGSNLSLEQYVITPQVGSPGDEGYIAAVLGTRLVAEVPSDVSDDLEALGTRVSVVEGNLSDLTDRVNNIDATVSEGGESNQNAYSYVQVGADPTSKLSADAKTDTLYMIPGNGIEIATSTIEITPAVGAPGDEGYVAPVNSDALVLKLSSTIEDRLNALDALVPASASDTDSLLILQTDDEGNPAGYAINTGALLPKDTDGNVTGAIGVDSDGKLVLNTDEAIKEITGIQETTSVVDGETVVTGYTSVNGLTLSTETGQLALAVSPGAGIEISTAGTVSVAIGTSSSLGANETAAASLGFEGNKLVINSNLIYENLGEFTESID